MQNFFLLIAVIILALLAYARTHITNENFMAKIEPHGITREKIQGWIYPNIDFNFSGSEIDFQSK